MAERLNSDINGKKRNYRKKACSVAVESIFLFIYAFLAIRFPIFSSFAILSVIVVYAVHCASCMLTDLAALVSHINIL